MQIIDIDSFIHYYERIRSRTLKVMDCIPPEKLDWTYKPGKFTIGDLVRHIAAIERDMYAETVLGKPSRYRGCGKALAKPYGGTFNFFNRMHQESINIFKRLDEKQLNGKCKTPMGTEITVWKWLRAMVEHEVHHRGQIYLYLNMLNIDTPPLYGLTAEEVESLGISKSKDL